MHGVVVDKWMDGWIFGWMDGWMEFLADGWVLSGCSSCVGRLVGFALMAGGKPALNWIVQQ